MNTEHAKTHWADALADKVLAQFPKNEAYTCAAGISPSGVVHFGNFRDVITSFAVAEKLKERKKMTRLLFSWDDFDRFRKVPQGVAPSFEKYIGMPLSAVPCPLGKYSSYAERYEKEFEGSMKELDLNLEYRYQTKEYQLGRYDAQIAHALKERKIIAEILLSFMTDKGKSEKGIERDEYIARYYPISVYSRFSGKDNTEVLEYDGGANITYKCRDSGKTETIDFTKEHIVKLSWKIDWPMRWSAEGVVFEPGGHDHASPGGSFDVARVVADKVFGIKPPVFQEYLFVGLQGLGTKMSGSKGNAVSPRTLLEIYTPELLKWIYLKKPPTQPFSVAFNTEIYKQYGEFDASVAALQAGTLEETEKISLSMSGVTAEKTLSPIPFRQAVSFGQVVQWDLAKLNAVLEGLDFQYAPSSIDARLPKARAWLELYNKEEVLTVRESVNSEYAKQLGGKQIAHIRALRAALAKNEKLSLKEIEKIMYDIPKEPGNSEKENVPLQKMFFRDVYNLLISRDAGPRLSTFLWALPRERVLALLNV